MSGADRTPGFNYKIPEKIMTPDTVPTRIGTLEFVDGVPTDETVRLEWAGRFIHVPHVLEAGYDDAFEWLATRAIAGESAVAPRWIAQPDVALRAVGEAVMFRTLSTPEHFEVRQRF